VLPRSWPPAPAVCLAHISLAQASAFLSHLLLALILTCFLGLTPLAAGHTHTGTSFTRPSAESAGSSTGARRSIDRTPTPPSRTGTTLPATGSGTWPSSSHPELLAAQDSGGAGVAQPDSEIPPGSSYGGSHPHPHHHHHSSSGPLREASRGLAEGDVPSRGLGRGGSSGSAGGGGEEGSQRGRRGASRGRSVDTRSAPVSTVYGGQEDSQ
jgi:hypothetical protein